MQNTKDKTKMFLRGTLYALGMITLALGIVLNAKANLGVSPIISVAYCFSTLVGINFGNASFLWYGVFVIAEIIIHLCIVKENKKRTVLLDALQLPLCLAFTRFMNLFTALVPDLNAGSLWLQLAVLLLGIVLTGIGAAMVLSMRLIPNPGDGIVQALADLSKKSVGLTKNCFDAFCITVTIVVGLVFGGGLIGVGIGTVLAVILVGRVMALYHFLFADRLDSYFNNKVY